MIAFALAFALGTICFEMELGDALRSGAIRGVFQGTGASSGDSITLRARATLALAVCPQVRPGTVLANAHAAAQDMVLVRVRGTPSGRFLKTAVELRFEPNLEREYVFDAYCLDFDKANPSEHDRFAVAGTAPEPILRIVQVPGSDVEARQLAIWAVTNDISAANATDNSGATDADIASARKMLLAAGLAAGRYRLFANR